MKRDRHTISDITGEEGRKRLEHYNKWLMDPKRPFGTLYPGYKKEKENEKSSRSSE